VIQILLERLKHLLSLLQGKISLMVFCIYGDYFSWPVVIGLPFGEKWVKTSSGAKMSIPNVLRAMRGSEIIHMYESHLESQGINDLKISRASYYRILAICTATKRRALTGLDYFIADGENVIIYIK
jgi:hypothetical protein